MVYKKKIFFDSPDDVSTPVMLMLFCFLFFFLKSPPKAASIQQQL